MRNLNLLQNPYLLFSPFLIIFLIYVLIKPTVGAGDELRYLMYAKNMLNGFYSPPAPDILLRNGPGYPLILIPFVGLKLPLISMTILNAFFYYFSITFLYKALNEIVSTKLTIAFSFAWACYYVAYQNLPYIVPETYTYFWISIFLYSTVRAIRKNENQKLIDRHIILSGIALGNIVLIKMLFGYVLVFMLCGVGLVWVLNRTAKIYKRTFMILTVALFITMPYLIYTYNLTGRMFYWGMGSDTLYWMSSPHEGEYGDWKLGLKRNPIHMGNYNIPGADSILKAHHEQDLLHTEKFKGLEWDDEFRKLAINNIKEHPLKYAENVVYNIGRLIFHYPFSHAVQRPKILMIFPINGAILTLMIFSLIVTIINWRKIPFYMYFLLVFCFLYLGASVLITTFVRMFTIVVPVLFIWIAFVLQNSVIINWKFKQRQNEDSI